MSDSVVLKLHHASLIVADIEKALEFYQKVLKLPVDSSRPDLGYPGVWLTLPGEQQLHLLQLDNPDKNSQRPKHGGRDHHIAFAVNSIDDIALSLEQLNISYTKSRSGRNALFCRDLDNNALEFIQQ